MKFSVRWLNKYVQLSSDAETIAKQLTSIGLEVESVEQDVIEVAVPPNRGDCLGVVGIARDLAALNQKPLVGVKNESIQPDIDDVVPVTVRDHKACPRFTARVIRNIDVSQKTPQWMIDCLEEAGVNVISPVVDVTNYVMLELGQALHAFDLNTLDKGIVVRPAKAEESLLLLDDNEVELTPETLVVADEANAQALAGIMGGKNSSVTDQTKDILLECAYFEPVGIRLTARRHFIQTDASYRFERCADPSIQEKAIERATELVLEIVGGQAGPVIVTENKTEIPTSNEITLRRARIETILGILPEDEKVARILRSLGMSVEANDFGWIIRTPLYRNDLIREIDLIEEIARMVGFDNIPAVMPQGAMAFRQHHESQIEDTSIIQCLVQRGYHEAITYSFIEPELVELLQEGTKTLQLTNPISADMAAMRPSLWPGLIRAVQYNLNRQSARVRLFEVGLRFPLEAGELKQEKMLAGIAVGPSVQEQWGENNRGVDFFDMKGDLETLFHVTGLTHKVEFKRAEYSDLHPGQSAAIICDGREIGRMGSLHPSLLKSLDIDQTLYLFELAFNALKQGEASKFMPQSKFPSIRRDLALVVDRDVLAGELNFAIQSRAGDLLKEVRVFDVYEGKGVESGKKSLAISLILQHPSRTLIDTEVNTLVQKLMEMLQKDYGASLRD